MQMTSRLSLLLVAGVTVAGCSSPSEGDIPDPPSAPPPGLGSQQGTAGTPQQTPLPTGTGGQGGTTGTVNNGAGGTAPAGTGGTVSAPVGTAGSAGSAGSAGAGTEIPTGTGNVITHDAEGWVAGTSNGLGIQGSFYTFSDATSGGATTIAIDTTTPTRACVSGTASAVPDAMSFGTFWGGGLALNLADPGGGGALGTWQRGAVTGFSFTISGPTIPPGLRFQASVSEAGPTYCGDVVAGPSSVQLSTLIVNCYEAGGMPLPATQAIQSLQWQVVTVIGEATPFDFCVENLTAITN